MLKNIRIGTKLIDLEVFTEYVVTDITVQIELGRANARTQTMIELTTTNEAIVKTRHLSPATLIELITIDELSIAQ